MNANPTSRSRALPGAVAVPASAGGPGGARGRHPSAPSAPGKHRGRLADHRPGAPGKHRRRQDDTSQNLARTKAGAMEASCFSPSSG
jgi:hypothetical protein